jgi:outer membrane lipoprotein-sorting protein
MRTPFLLSLVTASALSWAQTPIRIAPGSREFPPARAQRKDDSAKARHLLLESMSRQPIANVRVIISQRSYYASTVFQTVKVEMSKEGKKHSIVLSPLSLAGVEGVDDGVTLRTYTPDDQEVIEQPSASHEEDDVQFRMGLVDRNYTLRIDGKAKIAGRDVVVVQATPKAEDLETRCYSIDEKTGFLMRFETCKEGQAPMLHFETKMVQFPAEFSDGTFRIEASFARVEHYNRKCVSPQSAEKLRAELGFQPVVPGTLPYGFVAQELQTSTDSRSPALIVRITDGLAKVTVLEWKKIGNSRSPAPQGTVVDNSRSLTLLVSGDIPDNEKEEILRAFLGAVRAENLHGIPVVASNWVQELLCQLNLFPNNRGRTGNAPMIVDVPYVFRIGPN